MPKVGNAGAPRVEPPFRLLDLPPELWVRIGKLTIDDSKSINSRSFKKGHQTPKQPAITRVCGTLRSELLPYYYKTKVDFNVDSNDKRLLREFRPWLQAVGGQNRRSITGIITRRSGLKGPWLQYYLSSAFFDIANLKLEDMADENIRGRKYCISFPASPIPALGMRV